jgi:predicted membrane chloride channel (bestrophin family)
MIVSGKIPWSNVFETRPPHLVAVFPLLFRTAERAFGPRVPFPPTPFGLARVRLAILLAFHKDLAYDRYGEDRKPCGVVS